MKVITRIIITFFLGAPIDISQCNVTILQHRLQALILIAY
jgi:hypothetical protein